MAKNKYLIPLVLVTSLFFLWGFSYGLLDVLNKHFQETLKITPERSTLLQMAYFGAYFLMAYPAGLFMNKFGYKKGIIAGLFLFAIGAFLFYPASEALSFNFFLVALFVIASGLACLETAANPYITILGDSDSSNNSSPKGSSKRIILARILLLLGSALIIYKATIVISSAGALALIRSLDFTNPSFLGIIIFICFIVGLILLNTADENSSGSEKRLNLSQCFNGVGSFLGPLIAAIVFFGGDKDSGNLDSVKVVYIVIGIVVLVVAVLFIRTPLPEIKESEIVSSKELDSKSLISHTNFVAGVIAQFFYVAAQVGIAALFINYCTESGIGVNNADAAKLLSLSLILFTVGRFVGTALMAKIPPNKLLTAFALINILLCILVIWKHEWISVISLMVVFFFESIMFPTIFALGVKDLGQHTKKAASFIIMSIVGGAVAPKVMGILISQYHSTAFSYIVPLICFIVVAWYGWVGYKVKGGSGVVKVQLGGH